MFGLPEDLSSWSFLDCAAGASSFVSEARRADAEAMALDPMYALPVEQIVDRGARGLFATNTNVRRESERYNWCAETFPNADAHLLERSQALGRFIADIASPGSHERYLAGSLEAIPLEDGAVDYVMCSHFLFLHAAHFNEDFHIRCVREMIRVSRRKVLIFPLVGFEATADRHLAAVQADLSTQNLTVALAKRGPNFFRAADVLLDIEVSA